MSEYNYVHYGVNVPGACGLRTPMNGKSSKQLKILIVEDDDSVRSVMAAALRNSGFDVIDVSSIASGVKLLRNNAFDGMILDIELEDGEGFEILRLPMAQRVVTIVTSVRSDIVDRLVSLELGADDYMVKPIDLRELGLRLRRSLKRNQLESASTSKESNTLAIDEEIKLNLIERIIVSANYKSPQLTKMEFRALRIFLGDKYRIFSRDHLAKEVLGRRVLGDSRSVDALMSKLRRKIDPGGSRRFINSIRGEGYAFMISKDAPSEMLNDVLHLQQDLS